MKFSSLLPEEVRNAALSNSQLGAINSCAEAPVVYLLFNTLVIIVGAAFGYVFSEVVDDSILNAVIAFDGVIIGFVITSLLFSGRSQFLVHMSLEQTMLYCLRVKYILSSQISTLFSFLFCMVFCLLAFLVLKTSVGLDKPVLVSLAAGYFFLGCYRMILLPFQIFDIHSLALDALLEERADAVNSNVQSATEARLKRVG